MLFLNWNFLIKNCGGIFWYLSPPFCGIRKFSYLLKDAWTDRHHSKKVLTPVRQADALSLFLQETVLSHDEWEPQLPASVAWWPIQDRLTDTDKEGFYFPKFNPSANTSVNRASSDRKI